MSSPRVCRPPILLALLGLSLAAGAWAAPCVEAEIVQSPATATVGEPFPVKGAVKNCGERPAPFLVSWLLLAPNGDRIVLARRAVTLRPDHVLRLRARLLVRDGVHPGVYDLALHAEGRRGASATDTSPILVHPPTGADDGEE
jgi:hypothetical protein